MAFFMPMMMRGRRAQQQQQQPQNCICPPGCPCQGGNPCSSATRCRCNGGRPHGGPIHTVVRSVRGLLSKGIGTDNFMQGNMQVSIQGLGVNWTQVNDGNIEIDFQTEDLSWQTKDEFFTTLPSTGQNSQGVFLFQNGVCFPINSKQDIELHVRVYVNGEGERKKLGSASMNMGKKIDINEHNVSLQVKSSDGMQVIGVITISIRFEGGGVYTTMDHGAGGSSVLQ